MSGQDGGENRNVCTTAHPNPDEISMRNFSPKALEKRPEHDRSAGWFAMLCQMLGNPRLNLNCHLQNDGSQVFVFAEEYGRNFEYRFQVWPNGDCKGWKITKNSE